MIFLEPDDLEHGVVVGATQALDSNQYYAMVDSGTNATIVPLHPSTKGETAECQVPSATVILVLLSKHTATTEQRDWWSRSQIQQF